MKPKIYEKNFCKGELCLAADEQKTLAGNNNSQQLVLLISDHFTVHFLQLTKITPLLMLEANFRKNKQNKILVCALKRVKLIFPHKFVNFM